MGALQKIRSKSTLLVAVIGLGLLAFVIPWGEIIQFLNVSKDKAFVVNGDVVKTGEYGNYIEQAEELAKSKVRGGQLNEEQVAQLREEVYQTMVTERLLQDQAEELGIAVTDLELNSLASDLNLSPVLYELFGNPQTGEFDRNALNNYLTAVNEPLSSDPNMRAQQQGLRKTWDYIESLMRHNRLSEKYAALVSGAVLVNDIEAKAYYEGSKNVSDLAYVVSEYTDIADDSIKISDTELQDLYNIKRENFYSKYPSRNITYFVKDVLPSETDYSDTESQALEIKEELQAATTNIAVVVNQYSTNQFIDSHFAINSLPTKIKNFVNSSSVGDIHGPTRGDRMYTMYKYVSKVNAPDSIKIQTLPIQSFDPTLASAIADSLQSVIKQGKSFAELAREMFPSVPEIGKGEWVNEPMLAQFGIANKCFEAKVGEVLEVQINGMTSLLRIEEKTRPVVKAKIAVVTIPVIVSDRTNNAIDNEINKFLSENQDPKNFAQAALNHGYNVITDAVIYPNYPTINNIPSTRELIKWAFNESKGEIKKHETRDARILAVVTGSAKEGYLPISNTDVKEVLKNEILKNKKAEKITADLNSKSFASLSDLAETLNTKVDTAKFVTFQTNNINGVGYEPILNVLSKSGDVNTISKPMKGNNGVYVLSLVHKKEDEGEYDQNVVKNMLRSNYTQMLSYSAPFMLVSKMDVEDYRIKFY